MFVRTTPAGAGIMLGLLLAPGAVLAQNVTYQCKGPGGEWAAKYCTGAAAPKPSQYAIDRAAREASKKKTLERSDRWRELCRASGWDSYKCARQHVIDYAYMNEILTSTTEPKERREAASVCYLKWFKSNLGVVDARMWRYCFAHAGL